MEMKIHAMICICICMVNIFQGDLMEMKIHTMICIYKVNNFRVI